MSLTWQLLALAVIAYFIGSIPFGLIVGRLKGIDPRKAGSGNIGATNVGRLLGGRYFALVFTLDALKSLFPMLAAAYLLRNVPASNKPYLLWMLVGAGAILGHVFPIFLNFKGGKGVASSVGVMLGLWPFYTWPGMVVIGVFLLTFAVTRMVSLGSILGAMTFPTAYIVIGLWQTWPIFGRQWPLLFFAVTLGSLVLYKHRKNMTRILAGTEHSFKKETAV